MATFRAIQGNIGQLFIPSSGHTVQHPLTLVLFLLLYSSKEHCLSGQIHSITSSLPFEVLFITVTKIVLFLDLNQAIHQFCGCRRNEKRQTNDKFIANYRSIYTTKQMRILSTDPSNWKQMFINIQGQQMLMASLGCSHGWASH